MGRKRYRWGGRDTGGEGEIKTGEEEIETGEGRYIDWEIRDTRRGKQNRERGRYLEGERKKGLGNERKNIGKWVGRDWEWG